MNKRYKDFLKHERQLASNRVSRKVWKRFFRLVNDKRFSEIIDKELAPLKGPDLKEYIKKAGDINVVQAG